MNLFIALLAIVCSLSAGLLGLKLFLGASWLKWWMILLPLTLMIHGLVGIVVTVVLVTLFVKARKDKDG